MSMKTRMVKTSPSYHELSILHIFFLKVMDIGLDISYDFPNTVTTIITIYEAK